MDEFLARQLALLRQFVDNYRDGTIQLNSLVQRIDGVSSAIDREDWRTAVFPIVLGIEQVNAFALDSHRALTNEDKAEVDSALVKLDALIRRFEKL